MSQPCQSSSSLLVINLNDTKMTHNIMLLLHLLCVCELLAQTNTHTQDTHTRKTFIASALTMWTFHGKKCDIFVHFIHVLLVNMLRSYPLAQIQMWIPCVSQSKSFLISQHIFRIDTHTEQRQYQPVQFSVWHSIHPVYPSKKNLLTVQRRQWIVTGKNHM